MKISFRGHDLNVEINEYIPAVEGYTNGLPENCYPSEPAYVTWCITTGNDLLDELLCNDFDDEISELIIKKLEENAN